MSATSWTPALHPTDAAPAALAPAPAPRKGDSPLRLAVAGLLSIIVWGILIRASVEVARALASQ